MLRIAVTALLLIVASAILIYTQNNSSAQEVDCLMCHGALQKENVVHAALHMGCNICHAGIDATKFPHKITNKIKKGLSSEEPELCYGCHDKSVFTKKTVHMAVAMGCSGCHNPHSSKNERLLKSTSPELCFTCHDQKAFGAKKTVHAPVMSGMCMSCHSPHSTDTGKLLLSDQPELCYGCHDKTKFTDKFIHAPVGMGMCNMCHTPHQSDNEKLLTAVQPELCYNCHDRAPFSKKNVHMPVMGGTCLGCHKPHASSEIQLLQKEPVEVCLECHPHVRKTPHAIAGFTQAGHPVGITKKGRKPLQDPARPGKPFYCASCHNPHSSDWIALFRYQATSVMGICTYCHKY
ncbi:MAG: cytochrome c3 family protein [Thermodesulfovibrionales bacterium]|nr:cytochrome c3 family protein [Thermodesulfovibrionales bacterium]